VLIRSVLSEAEGRYGQHSGNRKRISKLEGIIDSTEEARNHLRRSTSRLQKSRLADITLNILGLLVDFKLRLGHFGIFVLAIPL
jgi:hypothetical protein